MPSMGLNKPGELLCDFCGEQTPVAYFPCEPFRLMGPLAEWDSGDRFYACTECRRLVEAGDWLSLRARCGILADSVRVMWASFRRHRQGAAVEFEPGTNPESERT